MNKKTFIIAELSANHNGDLNIALKPLEQLKELVQMPSKYKLTQLIL